MPPPLRPPDGLDEMPDALEPLGLRARIPPDESDEGIVELLRGSVLDEPGRLRAAESGLWKLGVRRTLVVGVFCAYPPSVDSSEMEGIIRISVSSKTFHRQRCHIKEYRTPNQSQPHFPTNKKKKSIIVRMYTLVNKQTYNLNVNIDT